MEDSCEWKAVCKRGLDSTAAPLHTEGHSWCMSPYLNIVLPCFLAHQLKDLKGMSKTPIGHQHVCFKILDKPMEVADTAGVNTKLHDSTSDSFIFMIPTACVHINRFDQIYHQVNNLCFSLTSLPSSGQ